MSLEKMIRETPLWRPCGFPFWSRNITLVCYAEDLPHINDIIGEKIYHICKAIVLINHSNTAPAELIAPNGSSAPPIPIGKIQQLAFHLNTDIVFFSQHYEYGKLVKGCEDIHRLGFHSFFVHMPIPYNIGITTTHLPNYLADNRDKLELVYAMLEDEESKRIFVARIRALITGNIGYIRLSRFPEYYHPQVKPQPGDVILDGGMSAYIGPQLEFCKSIGEAGHLYGFEPDPIGFIKAYDQVQERQDLTNFTVIPFGLWEEKTTLQFTSAGAGSHVSRGQDGVVVDCKMTTIDSFVQENKLQKVDLIKLDVEGSEFQALRAGIKTLATFKPRLAISLYHLPQDLYELPFLIKKILPDCKFYLGHHHASLHETILYVLPG